jgi:CheY-like chemotaxis protein
MANVLVVEDETFTLKLLTTILEKSGHTVLTAENGREGIAQARKTKPDLIIMDLSMPQTSGWDAIRVLKGDAATRQIPVIALSSATTAEDRDEAYSAGCDAYEAKPIDIERLLNHVKVLLH